MALLLVAALARASDGDDAPSRAWAAAALTRLDATDVRAKAYRVSGGAPALVVGRSVFAVGLDYEYVRFEYRDVASRNRDLHCLQIPVSWRWGDEQTWLSGLIAPGFSTSSNVARDVFNRAGREDLMLDLGLTWQRRMGATTGFVGAMWDRAWGRPRLYPTVGIETQAAPRWWLRLAFPDPALRLDFASGVALHLRAYPAGHQWHVRTDDFVDQFDYRWRSLRAELALSVPVYRSMAVDLVIGYATGRRHRLDDDSGQRLALQPVDAPYLGVRIRTSAAPP